MISIDLRTKGLSGVEKKLKAYEENSLLRRRLIIDSRESNNVVINGKKLISFCSNDYLGMASNAQVKKAMMDAVNEYGFGSSSAALICGYYRPHQQLEEQFADFLQRDRALLFNSGYHANLGILSAFANKNSIVLTDKLCHASIIDGVVLSRAKHYRYRHNDIQHAQYFLQEKQKNGLLMMTEGVFSMEGSICHREIITNAANHNQALTIVDDAHGMGVLGKNGKGFCEHYALSQKEIDGLVVPLGKAFCCSGAIVAGSNMFIEALLQFARTYTYTTAQPPALSQATLTALNIINNESWRRDKLIKLIGFFIKEAKTRNLPLASEDITPIKSILVGDETKTIAIQNKLIEYGFLISCIRPPTVPAKTSRIRISLNCLHVEEDIIQLLDLITNEIQQYGKTE